MRHAAGRKPPACHRVGLCQDYFACFSAMWAHWQPLPWRWLATFSGGYCEENSADIVTVVRAGSAAMTASAVTSENSPVTAEVTRI